MYRSSKADVPEYIIYDVYNGAQLLNTKLEYLHKLSIRNKTQEVTYKMQIDFEKYNGKHKKNKPIHVDTNVESNEIKEIHIDEITGSDTIITKLLNLLPKEHLNEYAKWIKITIMLKNNEKDYKKEWHKWSKNSSKYNYEKNEKIWNELKKREDGITIKSLHWIVKNINLKEYNNIMEEKKKDEYKNNQMMEVTAIINEVKNKYDPKYNMEIASITERCSMELLVTLQNNYCQWKKCDHDKGYVRVVIMKSGLIYLECTKCNKWVPEDGYILQNINQNIFNYNITNNYYNNKDNNEEVEINDSYNIFEDKELNKLIMKSLSNTPYDIALVLYYVYKNKFNCTKGKVWYEYDGNIWLQEKVTLRNIISIELTEKYDEVKKFYKKILKDSKGNDYDIIGKKINQIDGQIKSLKKTCTKNNIMTEAEDIFYSKNKDFEEKLNLNNNLIGFNNGIYDIEKLEFRNGNMNDYISITVGYEYKNEYSEKINDIIKFFEEIQPDKEEREYLLTYIASTLEGNILEKFHVFSGKGRNGKTILMDLIKVTFGEYYDTNPVSFLTKEQPTASTPRPDIITIKNKKIMSVSEPESKDKLNASFIKFLTGNDVVKCRNLYDTKMITFNANVGLILLCNDIPEFDKNDDAIWERCRVIYFPTKFVEINKKNEKKIDKELSKKIVEWKNDFILLLIEYYKKFKKEGINPTEKVMRMTNKQREETDPFMDYINNELEIGITNEKVLKKDIYIHFKKWYTDKNLRETSISNIKFYAELKKRVDVQEKRIKGFDYFIGIKTLRDFDEKPEYYTEKIVYNWLKEEFKNKKIISQAKFEWCKNKKENYLPYDIYIEEENLIIEIDGPQHFKQIKDWKNPSDTFATEIYTDKKSNKK